MPKAKSSFDFLFISTAPTPPLRQWLYQQVRSAILDGRLKPGARVPSSRTFAEQYRIARGTVVEAFEQLAAEGYIRSGVGAGTFVSEGLPDALLQPEAATLRLHLIKPPAPVAALSKRGESLARPAVFDGVSARINSLFNPYRPALAEFPMDLWGQIAARRARSIDPSTLGDGDPRGFLPLRQNIAHYLGMTRGVTVDAAQILIVGSVQQALDLTVRLLLNRGDAVWMEDPGYPGARAILHGAGAELIPVPVDAEGLQVAIGKKLCESARLAYVTPARQAPLGVGLSLSRRVELLEWASRAGAWIFEDDYDGEFRYSGRPLAALQSLDQAHRVIYAGSFSKTLFPALRIAYLVLPPSLIDAFVAARSVTARFSPTFEQTVLADFIGDGHYARHLRRMNVLYAERRAALASAIASSPQVFTSTSGDEAGLSLVCWLKPGISEDDALRAAKSCRLFVQPLKPYTLHWTCPPGLVFGFAEASPAQTRHAMKKFTAALQFVSL
jgi:GntR family transcriptional regulator/MocR family aminotransferase